jgi:hypothetical protein
MLPTAAALAALALAAGPSEGRLLLCRPVVTGDPALARAGELAEAGRSLPALFLDYGVPCQTAGEAARAAHRAGLGHAVRAAVEGSGDGSRFQLTLLDTAERELARGQVLVAPGAEARRPLRQALRDLGSAVPRPPSRVAHVAGVSLLGAAVAAAAAGVVLAVQARAEARRAVDAGTPQAWVEARDGWRRKRAWGAAALGAGGALTALGLTLRFAF